jgi:hypothetical protein
MPIQSTFLPYFFTEEMLDGYASNLAFNLSTHTSGKAVEEQTIKQSGGAAVAVTGLATKKITEYSLRFAASALLAPLGLDPITINTALSTLVMPEINPLLNQNRVGLTQPFWNAGARLLNATGMSSVISSNFYAYGAVCSERLAEKGELDELQRNLKSKLITYFKVPSYRTVSFSLGGLSALIHNVHLCFCRVMATLLYCSYRDREFLPIFEAILREQGSALDLRQIAIELNHKAILLIYFASCFF